MQPDIDLLRGSRVVYELEGMDQARARKGLVYALNGEEPLRADVYLPPEDDDATPLLLARARQDHPKLNESVDLFVVQALARNADFELLNHVLGRHAFDMLGADDRSREIIQRTLDFFAAHVM